MSSHVRFGLPLALLAVAAACDRSTPTPSPIAAPQTVATATPAPVAPRRLGPDVLAYMRATAPLAGSGPFDWTLQADEECIEGEHPTVTAAAASSCLARVADRAHRNAAALRALTPPLPLEAQHAQLLQRVEVHERVIAQAATLIARSAAEVDRRRGRFTFTQVWGGEGPEIADVAEAYRAMNGVSLEQQQVAWVGAMNQLCDAYLRCTNRDMGGAQMRCQWRSVVDGLSGEEPAYVVVADVDSPLAACDGTRAPCHDPPGGWR